MGDFIHSHRDFNNPIHYPREGMLEIRGLIMRDRNFIIGLLITLALVALVLYVVWLAWPPSLG